MLSDLAALLLQWLAKGCGQHSAGAQKVPISVDRSPAMPGDIAYFSTRKSGLYWFRAGSHPDKTFSVLAH